MNKRIFRVLEFDKIIQKLSEQAASSLGKKRAMQIQPATELDEVQRLQAETDEAASIIRLRGGIPLGGIHDIQASVKRAVIGGILNANECLDIASTIYGGKNLKHFIEELEEPELPIIRGLVEQLVSLSDLERHIKNAIDDHGRVMDGASERLRGIRSRIRTNESRVREKLESYTRSKSKMLSDSIITIRNDRYVLPVKQEYRGAIGGIVHDQSSSGQTLFMEPQAVVDLNNQLQEARAQEKAEIERILKEISIRVAEDEAILLANIEILGQIDFISARAKLGAAMRCSMPKMNDKGIIHLKQARHPLIDPGQVVANDIDLGEDYSTIVITGPNTGGKTVTIKTIGLCTLMAQSGLQVPALDGGEMAVFTNVFADIGDEQSIEQSLSTFSSHMVNIVDILQQVDHQSLVLFDELGAGTDPQEGAALAMSILDETIKRGATVVATTHYPELKAYGYNRDRVVNASVEFDVETLQPTYRLLIGVPGRSNAFEISRRLGLKESIIDSAKELIGTDSKSVENMIASLETSRRQAEHDHETARSQLEEAEALKRDLEKQWQEFDAKRERLYQKAEEKAAKAIERAREEAEEIVASLRTMKNQASVKEHEIIEARKRLEDASPELAKKGSKAAPKTKESKQLMPGDEVLLLTLGQKGTVVEKVSDKEYLLQIGIMKIKAKRKDIEFVKRQDALKEKPVATVKGSAYHVSTELDLRGERYEDALRRVEKYVDDALLAGYPQVSIIHGKGTGALRTGVQEFAKRHRAVKNYRSGGMSEGGTGVTVLEFQ